MKIPETHYETTKSHCVTFLAYEDPLGKSHSCLSLGLFSLTAIVLGVLQKHRDTRIVKGNNWDLSYILLSTLTLCFLCPCHFLDILAQSPVFCRKILCSSVQCGSFHCAAQTLTVLTAFKITIPGRMRRWLLIWASSFIIIMCMLPQVVHCGIWLATFPPFIDKDAHSVHGYIIIIICNKDSDIAFYCILGCLGTLAIGLLSRNLPDIFNEAKFLTFSMLMFCSVWISFLPVYQSTKSKVMVAMEVLFILAIRHHLCPQLLHYISKARNELTSSHKRQSICQKEKNFNT